MGETIIQPGYEPQLVRTAIDSGHIAALEKVLTGGQTNYYLVAVQHPNRGGAPYQAECEDIIHALGMSFEEGCEFKALWRTAAARQGNGKPGRAQLDQAVYDAQKRIHYATLGLKQAQQAKADAESDRVHLKVHLSPEEAARWRQREADALRTRLLDGKE